MKAHEMIAKVRNLPPISAAALELVNLIGCMEAGNDDMVRVIKQDGVLTAKLLRACNSAAMGLEEPVASVNQAVLVLGRTPISRMVMAISMRSPMNIALPAYAMEVGDLWRHSILAATAAEMAVTEGINLGVDSSTAFTIGLLHDIGKLITNQFLTRQILVSMWNHLSEGRSAVEAEKEVLETDHAEVGAALAYMWRLPDPIVEAIGLHHTPPLRPSPRLSALAFFADRVAHRSAAYPERSEMLGTEAAVCDIIGYSAEKLPGLIETLLERCNQTEELVSASC